MPFPAQDRTEDADGFDEEFQLEADRVDAELAAHEFIRARVG